MGDEEETRVCGRCKKNVAESNFALHETHCSRFLRLCPDCDENVPVTELEQHKQENHTQVKCPKCRKKMERRLLPEHEEEECPERIQSCDFCELEMPWTQLQEHAVACGSRTERCLDCGRYVKLSDREEHIRTCSDQDLYGESSPPKGAHGPGKTTATRKLKTLCKVCLGSFPAEEIKKHETRCTDAPKWKYEDSDDSDDSDQASGETLLSPPLRNLDLRPVRADRTRRADKDPTELSICPHCQLVLPWVTLCWHVKKCKVHVHLKHREAAV